MRSYICVLSTDNYLDGVLILNENLKKFNSKYPLLCLINENISEVTKRILEYFEIEYRLLKQIKYDNIHEVNNHWQFTFDKLNIFSLTDYEKIVYLDSDFLILKNIDELFDYEHLSLPLDLPFNEDGFCSAVMVVEPNIKDYNMLVQYAIKCNKEGRKISDQDVINECFDNIKSIPAEYNSVRVILDAENECYDNIKNELILKHSVRDFMKNDNEIIAHYIGPIKPFMLTNGFDDKHETLYNYYLDNIKRKKNRYYVLNNNTKITVIIPVYNKEKYLSRCLDSLINQTYYNLEIMIIDDCSTDKSIKICQEYAKKDHRVKIVKSESHKGVSHARNMGLRRATGEYIGFVDADDYIEPNMYELLIKNIFYYNLDFCQSGIYLNTDETRTIDEPTIRVQSNEEIMKEFLLYNNISNVVWDKLYNRKILYGFEFDETMSKNEDVKYIFNVIKRCNYIGIIDDLLYHYSFQKSDSLTRCFIPEKDFTKLNIIYEIKEYIANKYPNMLDLYYHYYSREMLVFLEQLNTIDLKPVRKEVNKIVSELSDQLWCMISTNCYHEIVQMINITKQKIQ